MSCSLFSPRSLSEQRRHKSPNRRRENIRIRKRNQLPGEKSYFWRVQVGDQSTIFLWSESRWWCWWFGKCPGPPLWNVDTHCLCELARCNICSYDYLLFWLYINFIIIHLIDKLLKELYSYYFQTVFCCCCFQVIKDLICNHIQTAADCSLEGCVLFWCNNTV